LKSNDHRFTYILIFLLLFIPFFKQWGINEFGQSSIDFPSFYSAVKLVFEEGLTPYARENWIQAKTILPDTTVYSFLYLPQSLLLLFPLKFLPYTIAKNAMLLINHALILLVLYLIIYKLLKIPLFHPFSALAALYVFSFNPLQETLSHGQVNLLVLVLICIAWYLTKEKKHPALIALALTLAIFLKLYPALLIVYYLIKKDYKVILWLGVIILVFTVIAAVILPTSIWMDWFNNVFLVGGYGSGIHEVKAGVQENQSIHGFTSRLFLGAERVETLIPSEMLAVVVPYLLSGAITIFSIYKIYRNRLSDNIVDLSYSLLLLVMVLVAPLSWNHHITFVIPTILIGLYLVIYSQGDWKWLALVILAALDLAFRIKFRTPYFRNGLFTLLISLKMYAMLALWVYYITLDWLRQKRQYSQGI
jgi:alpha-1,2-mannosyltransferase